MNRRATIIFGVICWLITLAMLISCTGIVIVVFRDEHEARQQEEEADPKLKERRLAREKRENQARDKRIQEGMGTIRRLLP